MPEPVFGSRFYFDPEVARSIITYALGKANWCREHPGENIVWNSYANSAVKPETWALAIAGEWMVRVMYGIDPAILITKPFSQGENDHIDLRIGDRTVDVKSSPIYARYLMTSVRKRLHIPRSGSPGFLMLAKVNTPLNDPDDWWGYIEGFCVRNYFATYRVLKACDDDLPERIAIGTPCLHEEHLVRHLSILDPVFNGAEEWDGWR